MNENINSKPTICHFTSVHGRNDTRILLKECKTLAESGFEVILVVADGEGDEEQSGVKIRDAGIQRGRLKRLIKTRKDVFDLAYRFDADIYHFHDPELIKYGLKLKKKGKRVIYDIHEDIPEQIKSKPYINKIFSSLIAWTFRIYENKAVRKFDHLLTATPFIRDRFRKITDSVTDINNYPVINELLYESENKETRNREVAYVGKITKIRGAFEMVKAMNKVKGIRLNLGGIYYSEDFRAQLKQLSGWGNINELGYLNRQEYAEVLNRSAAGLVLFKPYPNHINSQPNKLFEYMSAGVPVIASDFPLWKKIIENNDCGICVNPLNPDEIAEAVQYLVDHPKVRDRMGRNGLKLINNKYNWNIEKDKLITIYNEVLHT